MGAGDRGAHPIRTRPPPGGTTRVEGSTWVDVGRGRGRDVLQPGPDGQPEALHRVPPGVNLDGDAQGLAWYRVAPTPAGASEWSVWLSEDVP